MSSYDYVIIGSGSAGAAVAYRLAEDRAVRVLVIEAGGSDDSYFYRRPGALGLVYQIPQLKEKVDWGYRTTPQAHLDGRRMPWTRGKVLGGCSTVNGMLYVRGHRTDYDDWRDAGNPGWGWDDVLPHFKRLETHEDGETAIHGGSGPVRVTRQQGISAVSEAFVKSVAAVSGVPVVDDFNGGESLGAGVYHMTCADRRRSSTAVAYLYPAIARGNVDLVSGALALQIEIEGGRAVGVTYRRAGAEQTAMATREVIVSAGAVNSPQLLMLSGVGPAAHLRAHGLDVLSDLPGVGENLHDHLMFPIRFHATKASGHTSTAMHLLSGMIQDYVLDRGWFGKTFLEGGAFVKTREEERRPDLQLLSIPWAYPEPNDDGPGTPRIPTTHSFTVMPGLIDPKSRGTVRLASRDPAASPLIDPRYLADDRDMETLLRGFALVRDVARREPFSTHLRGEACPGEEVQSEDAIRAHIRLFAKTIYHPVGTCRMGADALAVVDHRLRVRGVAGLRVADASVVPSIPGGNTNAPCIMIGEKCAAMIREEQG